MKKEARYLVPNDYMADPSVHVFNGRLYIYPSHDWESGVPENDNGDHFNMKDYHVFSTDDVMNGEIVDHGVVLKVEDIPWAGRQLWDCDVAYKDGKYYMYFPMKDRNDIFRLGVAISDKPEGPFIPQPRKMCMSTDSVLSDMLCAVMTRKPDSANIFLRTMRASVSRLLPCSCASAGTFARKDRHTIPWSLHQHSTNCSSASASAPRRRRKNACW